MTRSQAREFAFVLLFEKTFHDTPISELITCTEMDGEMELDDFARALAEGADTHLEEIDALISLHSQNWKLPRVSRVALSALRIAIYEMLYEKHIPESVSINEAIELTKKYAAPEDAAYVNGVLGAISRRAELTEEKPAEEFVTLE